MCPPVHARVSMHAQPGTEARDRTCSPRTANALDMSTWDMSGLENGAARGTCHDVTLDATRREPTHGNPWVHGKLRLPSEHLFILHRARKLNTLGFSIIAITAEVQTLLSATVERGEGEGGRQRRGGRSARSRSSARPRCHGVSAWPHVQHGERARQASKGFQP